MNLVLLEKLTASLGRNTRRDKKTGCLLWTASVAGGGYGMIRAQSDGELVQVPSHRASWIVNVGPIPKGMQVCHSCDVRRCVEPKHLFLGSQKDNLVDCARKGRIKNAKLTAAQAAHVFTSRATTKQLVEHYGICEEVVRQVRKRRSYAWATEGLVRRSTL